MKIFKSVGLVCIFAFSISLAGGVEIIVDTSQAPDLLPFGNKVKSVLLEWFDKVGTILESPTYVPPSKINVLFDPNYDGVAYASGTNIVGSVDYYRTHLEDFGSMVHEMAHVIQSYRSCYTNDDWYITEGIADYVRFYHYEAQANRPPKPNSSNHYSQGYRVTAYFLEWINARYDPMIYWINKDCREGTYDPSIFKRLTGRTIDELWDDMLKSLKQQPIMDSKDELIGFNFTHYASLFENRKCLVPQNV